MKKHGHFLDASVVRLAAHFHHRHPIAHRLLLRYEARLSEDILDLLLKVIYVIITYPMGRKGEQKWRVG